MSTTRSDPLVLAYRTPNSVEARALAAELEDADIAVQIVGDFRDAAYPGLAISGMADKELWVAGSDAERCAALVADWRRRHHPDDQPIATRRFQFSMLAALLIMTFVAMASLVSFERDGNRQIVYAVVIQALVMAVFFTVAWRRARRGRATHDDVVDAEDKSR